MHNIIHTMSKYTHLETKMTYNFEYIIEYKVSKHLKIVLNYNRL